MGWESGVLEVHDNVIFEANAGGNPDEWLGWAGAVRLPSEIGSHLTGVVFCDKDCQGRLDSLRHLTKRC